MTTNTVVTLVALCACSATPTKRERVLRSFRTTVADDLADSGITHLIACGDVTTSFDQFATGASEPRACLARAFTTCTPARVDGAYSGMDSGPFYWSATVAPDTSGCEIRLYSDARNDAYGAKLLERHRCPGLGGTCTLVWSEDHSLCRRVASDAGASLICTELPPDIVYTQH